MTGESPAGGRESERVGTAGSSSTRCALCTSPQVEFRFEKSGFDHYVCRACTGLFVFPMPPESELERFYRRNEGDAVSNLCWQSSRRHLWELWDWSLGLVEHLCGRGPLLDIGCGAGQFLEFALQRGWSDLSGVELSAAQADFARQRTGAAIEEADLAEANLPRGQFAGVTLWDVIEHVPDPPGFTRKAVELLKPAGLMILSTPHRRGISMRVWGRRALVVMPPEHLNYHTRRSIRHLLEACGMEVKAIRCTHVYLREWLRWLRSHHDQAGDGEARYLRAYERVVGSEVFMTGMKLANKLIDATGLGDHLVVVAQRVQ